MVYTRDCSNGTIFRPIRILKWTKNRPFPAFLKWDEKWSQFFLFRENVLIFLNNFKRIKCDEKPSLKVCDHFSSTFGEVISPSRDVLSRLVNIILNF